ncbi:MAG: hypothetical protein ACREQ9_21705 [Candidatus Binatia bacterium]
MKKLVLMMAFAATVLFAAQNASAQCCDLGDTDGDTVAESQCTAIPGNIPDDIESGCGDVPGVACIGGRLDGPNGPEGCLCLAGTCVSDTATAPNSATDCANSAATACCADGDC